MRILYQAEQSECGLVVLAMLASAHHLEYDLATLRARYPISMKGATLKGLIDIANDMGLDSRALRCDVEDLSQLRLPACLHWRMNHFVVLVGRRRGKFIVHDPAAGRVLVTRAELSEAFTGIAMEVWPGAKFQRRDRRNRLRLDTVIPRTRTVLVALVATFVLALGIEVATLVVPVLQEVIIDDVLVSADTDLLVLLTATIGLFLLGQAATTAVRGIVQRNLSSALSIVVPTHVFRHMMALPPAWFEARSAADVVNRFDSGNQIHKTITTRIIGAGVDGIVAVVAFAAMALYNLTLALIVATAFAGYILVRSLWYGSYRQASAGSIAQTAKVQGFLWETMRGIAAIKQVNGCTQRRNQYLAILGTSIRFQNRIATVSTGFTFVHDLLFAAERIAIVYLGARSVLDHQFSVGMMTAFLSFRENFVAKASSLVDAAVEFRMLGIHLDRLADILLTEREPATALPFVGNRTGDGRISVRAVGYRYGGSDAPVLESCSLEVVPGEIVAIVGPSGAGKSTLLKIVAGQIQPTAGDVAIDGVSLSAMSLERLRERVAVVRQDDSLFAGTITENIAFLDDRPDHDLVREVAIKARIHEEIQRMPMGYNTLIGSMGTGLSGGQAQRIMLARALYRRPSILLLDEATSHLDVANERTIASVLRELGITQVIVAHRPDTIAQADRVVDIRDINGLAWADEVVVPFPRAAESQETQAS